MAERKLSPELKALLYSVCESLEPEVPDLTCVRDTLKRLLEFLASPAGRTDANCTAADCFMLRVWNDRWDRLPAPYHDILADIAGALHDTVSAPEIARSFESTPEQLLERVRSLDHGAA